jgi:uncharacterized membrane protein
MTDVPDTASRERNRAHELEARALLQWRRAVRYAKEVLAWNRLYRAASYLRSALWVVPFIAIVVVLATMPLLRILDDWLNWKPILAEEGAQAMFQTVVTLALSFLVFTFGSLLVAIQVASAQLTPRIIATALLRDNVVRFSVGLFVFTLIIAEMALHRADTHAQRLITILVGVVGVATIITFLFLIDYAARLLRPVSIAARVADEGITVINTVYPERLADASPARPPLQEPAETPARLCMQRGTSGFVLALDVTTLVDEARRRDGVIEFVPEVGDLVAEGEPLFALYGGAAAIPDRKLRATVAFGRERTLEQDPMFAFRIVVDIGLKALSAAINDPTTAVLAIDQVHRLLREIAQRRLRDEDIVDDLGERRLIIRTPNWEDFVHVACCEIRACGAGSLQIARRMRAMLEDLAGSVIEARRAALLDELNALDRAVETRYVLPEDLALARESDPQGLGGASRAARVRRLSR